MNIYIDKKNLYSIICQNKHPLYADVIKTLRKQLSLFFNFSKNDINGDDMIMPFFQLMSDGAGESKKIVFLDENIFPDRPIKKDCIYDFSHTKLSAVYLIDDENVKEIIDVGGILVGTIGEEFDIFEKLFLQNLDYDFHKEIKIGSIEFNKWSDLSKFNLPLTDIIFIDRYILNDLSLIKNNLIGYLNVLCEHSRDIVNIVLYIDKAKVAINYDTLILEIKTEIIKTTTKSPHVTIVEYAEQRGQETLGEHDRTIFTNYLRIKSGDSYNYFLSNGNVTTRGREISYNSLAKKDSYNLAMALISDLQTNINFLIANRTGIHGDLKSNYLKLK